MSALRDIHSARSSRSIAGAVRSAPTLSEYVCVPQEEPVDSALRGTFWANLLYIANALLRSCLTLVLMPVLITLLGTEQYALWISISTLTMYMTLCEAGLGQTVVNYVGNAYSSGDLKRVGQIQATAHILYWMLVIPMMLTVVVGLTYLPVADWLLADVDIPKGPIFVACLMVSTVLSLARIPMLVFPGLLSGMRQLPLRLMCEMGATILAAIATVLMAWFDGGLMGLAIASNVVLLCTTTGMSIFSSRGRPWAKLRLSEFRPELLRPLASNSGYFFLMSCAGVLDRSVLMLMVAKFGSLALAPPIHFLLNVFRVAAWSLIAAMSRAVQPYVLMWQTLDNKERIVMVASLTTKFTSIAASLFVVAFVPFAEPIINRWLGAGLYPGMSPVLFIAAAFVVDAVFLASTNLLIVMNEHRKLAYVLTAKSVLVLVLAVVGGMFAIDAVVGLTIGVFVATILGNFPMPWVTCAAIAIDRTRYTCHFLGRPLVCSLVLLMGACGCAGLTDMTIKLAAVATLMIAATIMSWFVILEPSERQICGQIWQRLRSKANRKHHSPSLIASKVHV